MPWELGRGQGRAVRPSREPGRAESVMDPKARLIFDRLMRSPLDPAEALKRMMASGELDMNPFRRIEDFQPDTAPIVTPEELDVYVHAYEKSWFSRRHQLVSEH